MEQNILHPSGIGFPHAGHSTVLFSLIWIFEPFFHLLSLSFLVPDKLQFAAAFIAAAIRIIIIRPVIVTAFAMIFQELDSAFEMIPIRVDELYSLVFYFLTTLIAVCHDDFDNL